MKSAINRTSERIMEMKREDYQAIIDLTAEKLGIISKIEVKIKDIRGGRANKGYIALPKWLEKYDEQYQIYYAVHETCHYAFGMNHGVIFKAGEDKTLALWDIEIIRKKAYPKLLYANGKRIDKIL